MEVFINPFTAMMSLENDPEILQAGAVNGLRTNAYKLDEKGEGVWGEEREEKEERSKKNRQ